MAKSLEGVLVKPAHVKTSYTQSQIVEFARCADAVAGPLFFLTNFFYIQHPTKGRLKYAPFDYQDELIDIYHNNRFSINLLGRQMGKTTTAAGYLLWYAMFVPDSTILIAAHKYTGAQEIMQRIRYAYELCPNHIRAGVVSYNKGSIDFENGSRIVSATTTETTGRGMSISLLYADEFAFVRPTIAKEFWTSISPTLATGGKAIITSTPNSDEDQFWLIWKGANRTTDEFGNERPDGRGENGFKGYVATWDRHPDRDSAWAAQERASIGIERFKREHECEPIIYDETLISPSKLMDMAGLDPIEKQGQVRWYKKPDASSQYVIALDPSLGTGGDNAAIQVFEVPSLIQVAEWKHNRTVIQRQIAILKEIVDYINDVVQSPNKIYYSIENNTLGEAGLMSIAEIGEENIRGIFLSEPARAGQSRRYRKGFTTTAKSKLSACSKFKMLIETERLTVNSKPLISELKNFVSHGVSFSAKPGEKDDLVMSTMLVVRMVQMLQNFDSDLDSKLKDSLDDYIEPMPFIML
jgi:hypothetical protein